MGSPDGTTPDPITGEVFPAEPGHEPEEAPVHEVLITRPFYLQSTEVTQGQWSQVMGDSPSYFWDCGEGCPVERVRKTEDTNCGCQTAIGPARRSSISAFPA